MLGNYFSDGNLEDPPNSLTVLIPTQYLQVSASSLDHSENNVRDGTSSQTTEAQTYQWADPGVAFVDTPGFADTRGVETDDKNVLKFLEHVSSLENLTGIIIVQNGSRQRADVNARTTLERLRGNIPDVALNNIVYVLTNVEDKSCCNVSSVDFNPRAVLFMNNSAFSGDPTGWSTMSEYARKGHRQMWKHSMECIENFINFGETELEPFDTSQFKIVLDARVRINTAMHEAITIIMNLQETEEQVKNAKARIEHHLQQMGRNQDYEQEVAEYRAESRTREVRCSQCNGSGGSVQMQVFVVLTPFGLMPQQAAMRVECSACDGCGQRSERYSENIRQMVRRTNDEMKRLYQQASNDHTVAVNALKDLESALMAIDRKIDELTKEIESKCSSIIEVCSRFNFSEECKSLIDQLKVSEANETVPSKKRRFTTLVQAIKSIAARATPTNVATERHEIRQAREL